jgi:hypothetical protein
MYFRECGGLEAAISQARHHLPGHHPGGPG